MKPTMDDVARVAKVSRATVSRVLRGDVSVTSAKQRRVRNAIEELGYQPLKQFKGQLRVGLQLPSDLKAQAYYRGVAEAVLEEARRIGCSVSTIGRDGSTNSLSGLICVGHSPQQKLGFPVVVVGCRSHAAGLSAVSADERRVYAELVSALRERGHERIAFVSGVGEDPVLEERLRAFKLAVYAARHPVSQLAFVQCEDFQEGGETAVRKLLVSFQPTVVAAASDELADVVSRTAAELELIIPSDLAIIGCRLVSGSQKSPSADTDAASYIAVPVSSLGSWAVRILLGMAEGDNPAPLRALVSCGIHWGSLADKPQSEV